MRSNGSAIRSAGPRDGVTFEDTYPDTEMVRRSAAREPEGMDAALARYGRSHPLGRIGTGEDIANVVLFLTGDTASFMTGEYVCVDGGYMALGAWAGGAGGAGVRSEQ